MNLKIFVNHFRNWLWPALRRRLDWLTFEVFFNLSNCVILFHEHPFWWWCPYIVPIAFTRWMMCKYCYFLDGVFLYCLWKENSLLNLFVSLSVFLISFVTWYLLYLLICVIPHILNKLLLPYHIGIVFFRNGVTWHSRFSF